MPLGTGHSYLTDACNFPPPLPPQPPAVPPPPPPPPPVATVGRYAALLCALTSPCLFASVLLTYLSPTFLLGGAWFNGGESGGAVTIDSQFANCNRHGGGHTLLPGARSDTFSGSNPGDIAAAAAQAGAWPCTTDVAVSQGKAALFNPNGPATCKPSTSPNCGSIASTGASWRELEPDCVQTSCPSTLAAEWTRFDQAMGIDSARRSL